MSVSSIISEIQRLVKNRNSFAIRRAFDAPVIGGHRRNIAITCGTEKLEWRGYQTVKKV